MKIPSSDCILKHIKNKKLSLKSTTTLICGNLFSKFHYISFVIHFMQEKMRCSKRRRNDQVEDVKTLEQQFSRNCIYTDSLCHIPTRLIRPKEILRGGKQHPREIRIREGAITFTLDSRWSYMQCTIIKYMCKKGETGREKQLIKSIAHQGN